MRTAEGTLPLQLRSAFLSQSASRAAGRIFPAAVFPHCLRVWAQEFDMKRPFLCFGLCMFNLQLSSVCLPCGHMSACMCFFFFFNTKFRAKKPNSDGKKTYNSMPFSRSLFTPKCLLVHWQLSVCICGCPGCPASALCFCFVWFDFRDWAMYRCLAHRDLLL